MLAGMLVAWALAQAAMGVFFSLAFALGRREKDYLIFAALCSALALTSAGMARLALADSPEAGVFAAKLVLTGSILAPVINLHYALRYGAPALARRVVVPAYGLAIVFEIGNALGAFWVPGSTSVQQMIVLGGTLNYVRAEPTAFALVHFSVTGVQVVAAQVLFLRAHRRGEREALVGFLGGLCLFGAAANDIMMVMGFMPPTLLVLPHVFMLYAFAVASTVVLRYRSTAGELDQAKTHLRRAAEELRVSYAELREVQSTLETKEHLAVVGELAASIAHEVRNPLAIIGNAVAGLRRVGAGGADHRVLLDIVEEEAGRLNQLVTDLLRFARPVKLTPASIDLAELAQVVAGADEPRLDIELMLEPVRAFADEGLLRVALTNLVDNARQASTAHGRVTVGVKERDIDGLPHACIEVRDTGSGMSADVLARACDPFFTTRPSGTGLGLAIVQRIVRAHGGKLEFESELGKGTRVRLIVPSEAPLAEQRA
jgi:signal transduction histidine kinase